MKYILKRKTYSDDNQSSGFGKKLLVGAGLAAAAGGSFAAARRGLLGANTAKSANNAWMSLGNKLATGKNKTINSFGKDMINSGASKMGDVARNQVLKSNKLSESLTKDELEKLANKRGNIVEGKWRAYYNGGSGIKAAEGSQLSKGTGFVNHSTADIEKYKQDRSKR